MFYKSDNAAAADAGKKARGAAAEARAAAFLRRRGARVLAANYACKGGEIDLVVADGDIVAFVEVRLRDSLQNAANSIDRGKQRRLQKAAAHYMRRHDDGDAQCYRFDAVLADSAGNMQWLKEAFLADDE